MWIIFFREWESIATERGSVTCFALFAVHLNVHQWQATPVATSYHLTWLDLRSWMIGVPNSGGMQQVGYSIERSQSNLMHLFSILTQAVVCVTSVSARWLWWRSNNMSREPMRYNLMRLFFVGTFGSFCENGNRNKGKAMDIPINGGNMNRVITKITHWKL